MAIFSVYVVNKAGGLIYQYDNYVPRAEVEKTFSFPLDLVLKIYDEKLVVSFGQRDGIRGVCVCVCKPSQLQVHRCSSARVSHVRWVMRFCPLTGWVWTVNTQLKGRRSWKDAEMLPTIQRPSDLGDLVSPPMRNSCWHQCFIRE